MYPLGYKCQILLNFIPDKVCIKKLIVILYLKGYNMAGNYVGNFVKDNRSRQKLTQEQLADKAGVGLRFVRELEQGKSTLRTDKVNQVLALFGYSLVPGREMNPYDILESHCATHVRIYLKNRSVLEGFIIGPVRVGMEIKGWRFVNSNNAIAYQANKNPDLELVVEHHQIDRIENIT